MYCDKIRPNLDVIFQNLGEETVLLHIKTEEYYILGETSSRMWQMLMEYGEVAPVIARMLAEYDVDEVTLKKDLEALIADCEKMGLLYVDR